MAQYGPEGRGIGPTYSAQVVSIGRGGFLGETCIYTYIYMAASCFFIIRKTKESTRKLTERAWFSDDVQLPVLHSRHVCCVRQQKCLLCHTADMSAVANSRHACCVTADMSVVLHSRRVCCVTEQTCLLCHTANMSAVSHSRQVCCVTQQTPLLCDAADISAVSHSRIPNKVITLFVGFPRTAKLSLDKLD